MFTLTQIKESLIGMGHGGTLNKVRNQEAMFERVAGKFLLKCKPLDTMRLATLTSSVYDDVYNYALPSDYGAIIDLIPQDNRNQWDNAFRRNAGQFDLEKAVKEKTISIEGDGGTKFIRINWRSRQPKVLNTLDSLTGNGTWSAVASAANVALNTIFKVAGSGSIEFDLVATGDGIKNTTMTAVDLTDEDEVADVFVWLYFPSVPTSVTARWGNDLTTKYWTSTAQTTQADGTAFKVGWNLLKFSWASATETGTVDPTTIDSFQITIAASAAINNLRVDNILFAIGRNFDIKYYSKYFFKTTAGVYESRPSSDDDYALLDNDSLPIFLYECLKEMAQQMEGTDGAFDITYARQELAELYPNFKSEYPDQRKKTAARYGTGPRWRR